MAPNHRANDVVVLEDRKQVLKGKFSYGPLDFALSSEKVDIYISINRTTDWEHYSTEVTDNHGKLKYELPHSKRLPLGMYSVKMVVRLLIFLFLFPQIIALLYTTQYYF